MLPVDPTIVPQCRIGYVVKMYPRFSETFIVNEILAREALGTPIDIFSARLPIDGRFHETLAAVRANVAYLRQERVRAEQVWDALRQGVAELPGLTAALPDLLAAEVEVAVPAVELARAVRARGIGHLHAHFGSVATSIARLAAKLTDVPYSFTAHAKDIFIDTVDAADLQTKLDDAHHVVTVSDYNVSYLRAHYDVPEHKLHRVYNGIDLTAFPYSAPADRPPVIAAVGRLVEKKGFSTLIAACELLRQRGYVFRCVLGGAGPLVAELRTDLANRGLTDIVELPGALPQNRVRDLVGNAACFAAPCVRAADGNRDGLPTVLLEAMALGTPCVSTDVTGIPEIIRPGETGLRCRQRDPGSLADALALLLDNPGLRVGLARRARDLMESEFDAVEQARRLNALLPTAVTPPVPVG